MKALTFTLSMMFMVLAADLTNAQSVQGDTVQRSELKNSVAKPSIGSLADLPPDTVMKTEKRELIPKRSGLYSALIPGLGQIYNRDYWKVPIVYALCGVSIYYFIDNSKNYQAFRKEYAGRTSKNPAFVSKFPQYEKIEQIENAREYYKRNLDLTGLLTGVGYALQVMDAVASGHLKGFDISPDISLRMKPVVIPQGGLGVGLVMNFK
jgi:hypothetical protein